MSLYIRKPRITTVREVYEEVVEYCELHDPSEGVYWRQESYRFLFFNIFYNACRNGHCSGPAQDRFKRLQKRRKKRLDPTNFVVCGEAIRKVLGTELWEGRALTRDRREMIEDLTRWWDEWTYAAAGHIPRKYFRKGTSRAPHPDDGH